MTTAADHMKRFLESLSPSSVEFLRFFKVPNQQGLKPYVESFKHWNLHGKSYYVGHGSNHDGWCYVYRESVLKVMVTIYPDKSASVPGNTPVNFGNHLTIGIRRMRNHRMLMSSHYRSYSEDANQPNLYHEDRPTIECNMFLDTTGVDENTKCEPHPSQPNRMLGSLQTTYQFDKDLVNIIQAIRKLYVTGKVQGGSLCFGKRGGRYIVVGNKKKYIKKRGGGQALQYKGYTFDEVKVIAFLQKEYLEKVAQARDDMDVASILYDKYDELATGSQKHLLVIYSFERTQQMSIFYLDALHILKAYYASAHPQQANTTEKSCLQSFRSLATAHVPQLIHV